jgi:hypothetical protein
MPIWNFEAGNKKEEKRELDNRVKFTKVNGRLRCSAHLYEYAPQGSSYKSRLVYWCRRPMCSHYIDNINIIGKIAFCRNCESPEGFVIRREHIINNDEYIIHPVCCTKDQMIQTIGEQAIKDYVEKIKATQASNVNPEKDWEIDPDSIIREDEEK